MRKTLAMITVVGSMALFACTHVTPGSTYTKDIDPNEPNVMTDSRVAKRGSALSRGVTVIPMRRLKSSGEATTPEAMEKISPIVQTEGQ